MSVSFFTSVRGLEADIVELRRGLQRVDQRDALVAELEAEIRERTGARHSIACNSGTDALIALLIAAGVEPGDEVIVPAYSFFASASCVVHAGGVPVFVDIDPDSYAATVSAIEEAITPRTRAVLLVHLFHTMADVVAVADLCATRDLVLVEDSAEAIGMRRAGVHAGLFGAGGALSFFPTKTWGGVGDGGAVLTDDAGIARRARDAVEGRGPAPWTSRMDALQAAVLLARSHRLDSEIDRRRQLAERYTERLGSVPHVKTPASPLPGPGDSSVWYVYLIESDRRDELVDALAAAEVGTEIYYPRAIPDQPCFRGPDSPEFPVARRAATRALGLPLYADMDSSDVDTVCQVIRATMQGEAGR
ncbi:DegT/DnrJ/EryC1/StrS aminotransferase family protein [Clavibacter sp. VKM Ac-2872]|uniref:DegT/DnrJ/EryC1/StrS family aminotransferase n=1 Tax=Clavibacter sp. VKM Ac-2872 TaxID=2783812 RepID=UPI00188B8533|nr:DegT/DnrJ/EryC1/StrS family aminotransferase [Clavibacter sp. VKM Ac-2872]MBF4622766.1 DegT/DnrJ/EryC1/StrS family aminotransferase [Clavibacter sp. VKM Ac-2872]